MLLRPDKLKDEEKETVELLRRLSPEMARAQELALSFVEVVKERRADGLRKWLVNAQRSGVAEFVSFANGITSDFQAVKAALEYEWSNGQVEGQVHRLKLIKRQMYGRGKLDLLRARVLDKDEKVIKVKTALTAPKARVTLKSACFYSSRKDNKFIS